jgi:hypothetical protein
MIESRLLVTFGFWSVLLGACGGNASSECDASRCAGGAEAGTSSGGSLSSGGRASGGTASGGAPATFGGAVGLGGVPATSGGSKGSGGALGTRGGVCCNAYPTCDPGDTDIGPSSSCPQGATCYQRSLCCSTTYCAHFASTCLAAPSCDPGDQEISGECPPRNACYRRTLCGKSINCLDSACDPETEYNRKYVATSPSSCAVIDFRCQTNTSYFQNDCGCGCEQDANCPPRADCQPGGSQSALCSDNSMCPLTPRYF